MFYGFAFRVALILVPILIIGIITSSVLSLYKFRQTFSNILDARFEFVTSEIRNDIEHQMDLGLALENLQIVEVLEAYYLDDRQILSLEVFNDKGVVLHSSDSSSIGDLVPEEWVSLWQLNVGDEVWSVQEIDAGTVGTSIQNNLGQDVGSLVLRYSRDYLDQKNSEQAHRLFTVNSIAAGIAIFVAFIGAMLLLNPASRELKLMGRVLNSLFTEEKKDASADRASITGIPTFRRFVTKVRNTYQDMDSTIIKARELDEDKDR